MDTNDESVAANGNEGLSRVAEDAIPEKSEPSELGQQMNSSASGSGSNSAQASDTKSLDSVATRNNQVMSNGGMLQDDDARERTNIEEEEEESEDGSEEDEDEDSGEDGEDEDEDDEEESEPALKYDVLEGETPKLFERDSASALSLSSKYIVGYAASIVLFDLTSSRS